MQKSKILKKSFYLCYTLITNQNNKIMTNANLTIAFLNSTDLKVKNEILTSIANHYGITKEEAFEEITDEEAEELLDYLTGNIRSAVSVLFQKFKYNLTKVCG